jgi:hypothetical protein
MAMRFMMIVRTVKNSGPPPKGLMDAIAKLGEEATKAGEMIESGRLRPKHDGGADPAVWRKAFRDRWALHRG